MCLFAADAFAVSGVVYDGASFEPVSNAVITLVDDTSGAEVARNVLGPGQQGQRTGAQGTYQFDPPPGTYRIVVAPPVGLFEFPGRPPIGANDREPFGALAVAGPNNQVSPDARPTQGAVNAYYLRFTSAGVRGEFTNNHIPLTAVGEHISFSINARTPRITTGEHAAFTVTIGNASKTQLPEPALAPMTLSFDYPAGFKLSGELVARNLTTNTPVVLPLAREGASLVSREFVIPAGATYEIRYMMLAGPQVQPKRYAFAARLEGARGPLQPRVQAGIEVEADPIFERSEIIGRVFCDENKNGFFDPGEPPITRARIYLDNGSYSVADGAGKFHFSNVQPGYHLAKIDENTVPPGSTPTRSIRRDFHLTWGLPAKIDFGFTCAHDRVTAYESKPPKAPTIDISGKELSPGGALAVTVGEDTYRAHAVDVDLRAKDDSPTFDGTPRTLAIGPSGLEEIVFHTRVQGDTPVHFYSLIVRNLQLDPLYRIDGAGPPPKEIASDLKDHGKLAVEPNTAYFYDLTVWSSDMLTRSARRSFTVGSPPEPASQPTLVGTLRGELFSPTGKALPELLAKIGELKEQLLSNQGPVFIEAHVANDGPPADRQALTDKRANAVRTALISYGVAPERITAVGKADKEPLVPNLGQKGKEQNRRVEIRMIPMLAASQPASMPASLPEIAFKAARVHGVDVAYDDGEWKTNVFPTEKTTVYMQEEDGRAFGVRTGYTPPAQTQKERADVQGGIGSDAIFVDGLPIAVPLATFGCSLQGGSGLVKNGALVQPLTFTFTGKIDELDELRLGVYDASDTLQQLVRPKPGEKIVAWEGGGTLAPGPYFYRCAAKDKSGGSVTTAPELFTLSEPTVQETTVRGDLFREKVIGLDLKRALDQLLATVGNGAALTVSVHSGAGPTADSKREQMQTQVEADIVKAYLAAKGAKNVTAKGIGKTEPLLPPLGRRATEMNRRVVINFAGPASDVADLPALKPPEPRRALANGQELKLDDKGQFAENLPLANGALTVQMHNGQGRETVLVLKPGAASLPTGGGRMPFAGEPTPELGYVDVEENDEPASIPASEPDDTKTLVTIDLPAENAVIRQDDLVTFAHGPPGTKILVVDASLLAPELAASQPSSQATPSSLAASQEAPPAEASLLATDASSTPSTPPLNEPVLYEAASQPSSMPASTREFVINDEGTAEIVMPLKDGKSQLAFFVTPPKGETTKLVRKVEMSPNRWFLLALGEGSFGQSGAEAMLPEVDRESTVHVQNNQLFLHGRAALYFKARLKGDWFFKDNRFTAYVDTAQPQTQTFWRNVVEPDKFYPIYGDASEEVQDAQSGRKLYVRVEADQSKLEAGNIMTGMKGVELFRYDRAIFGAKLNWDRGFSKYDHTKLDAFVGQPLQGSRRVHVAMRGTGGALYFLRDRDVVEGSDQVRIVVRDSVSGTVVQDVTKRRNVDYTIAYDTGRIVFLEPVSAYGTGSFGSNLLPPSVQAGNPVYIEVDYEARDYGIGTQISGGGYVKETLFDRVTIGGGFLQEQRGDGTRPDYRLYGGSLEAKPYDGITVTAELNRSEGRDTDLSITTDGGQSFSDLQRAETVTNPDGSARPVTGYAMKGTFAFDFQKIFKFPRELVTVSGYAARIDPNFYASGGTFEQGQVKFGVAAKGAISTKDFVLARHDGIWSDLPALTTTELSARRMNRQLSMVGYEHVDTKWDVGLSYFHGYADDSDPTVPDVNTDTITLRGSYKITPRLTAFGTQEFVLRGDPKLITRTADQFATEVGLRFQFTKQLEGVISEMWRYGGSNATTVGLRTPFGEDGRVYVNERFSRDMGGWTATTIVGGENAIARGSRAYGEYQVDATAFGPQARAVYGLNNRWELADGLYFNMNYERSQNVGQNSGTSPIAANSFVGQGSSIFSRDRAFYNPSAILGLQFPVGIASRDAASVGVEFVRLKNLKITARVELRFDNQDINLGGADRFTFFTTAGMMLQLHRDLAFQGRVEWADAREWGQLGRPIASLTQMTFGFSYRPVKHDWVNALVKYTRRGFLRPPDLGGGRESEILDVVSLVPVVEIPLLRTQLVEKLAVKLQQLDLDNLPRARATTLLWINRLNFHVLKWLDLGLEYRMKTTSAQAKQDGFLAEVSVSPWEYVRVGVGYNFTHFSDDELSDDRIDNKGFFIRAAAKY